ncbi:arylsulfatase [Pseudomonas sp. CM25]|uniref:arylsulfatase n=1 Tax=Pseudomonas sp. CM25 TaxID=2738448 RepID=UPI0015536FDC|nr:arylsulfatase [Pseudomonas sp. CM25]NQD56564.1 arylsulfatase [Pseudomonas sp. CM25]
MRFPFLVAAFASLLPALAAAAERPNILLIVADDLGYSDLGAFGGEISTPNLDKLASSGLVLTNMYAAPTCSPTRAMLMSGTDNHLVGLGTMAEGMQPFQRGKPGYEGYLNREAHSIAELLRDGGYRTSMVGKWHLGSAPDQGPDQRGFENSFSLLEGGGVHFKPPSKPSSKIEEVTYRENGQPVDLPEDFYSTDFYTDKMISFLRRSTGSEKPFFAYVAYTSPHWPLQAPDEYLDKYHGRYDQGYDIVRQARIDRLRQKGLLSSEAVPASTLPVTPMLPGWEQLSPEQRKTESRKMEIYAAMVDNLDHNVGRLLDYLKASGQYENTLIVFMSDNGAAGERHELFYPAGPDTDNSLGNLGRRGSQIDYGLRWAEVSSAPFRLFKGSTAEGGISVPAIVHMPQQFAREGVEQGVARVDDLAPTFLSLAGVKDPGNQYHGQPKHPITGLSMLPMLKGKAAKPRVFAGELFGSLYYREGNLKLLGLRPWALPGEAPKPLRWQLFDLSRDRGEVDDLSADSPQTLERLKRDWQNYATRVGVVSPPQEQAQ